MTITITVANQKGGTGKTTIAANLAAGLAARLHPTLAVDLDTQGQLARFLGFDPAPGARLMLQGRGTNGFTIPARPHLALLPGDKSTGPATEELLQLCDLLALVPEFTKLVSEVVPSSQSNVYLT